MLTIEMLPAAHGDALWLEYPHPNGVATIVIDGGPAHTYEEGLRSRVVNLPAPRLRQIDLFVVTHIDADHIDGALILLQERAALNLKIDGPWFNGWPQIEGFKKSAAAYAPLQGEFLGGLVGIDPILSQAWNQQSSQQALLVADEAPLPVYDLPGGARLTLLGPRVQELRRLRSRWASAIRDFAPGDVDEALRRLRQRREYKPPPAPPVFSGQVPGDDRAPANGSSISFVLEVGDVRVLLSGDAHATTLAATLKRFAAERGVGRIQFDCIKLPHHGSMSNVSADWLSLVDCQHWLISTNGAVFEHPNLETADLIAGKSRSRVTLYCNYASATTRRLQEKSEERWDVVFPVGWEQDPHVAGIAVHLGAKNGSGPAPVTVGPIGQPAPALPAASAPVAAQRRRSR